jgi:cytochrome c oxidase subunit 4
MNDKEQSHVVPLKVYLTVGGVLLFLTVVTVLASQISLGILNTPLALGIATLKATIVALFFMHLIHDERMNMVVFASGVLFLAIFIALTVLDPLTRGDINSIEARPIPHEQQATRTVSQETVGTGGDVKGH